MPEVAVRTAWERLAADWAASSMRAESVRNAAATFDVSTSAMWYRLFSFALVPSKPDAGAIA